MLLPTENFFRVHLRYTQGLLPELGPYDIRSDGREENSLEMFNDVMSNYIKRISELTQMFHRFGTSTPAEQSKRVELVFSTADLVEACAEPTVKLLWLAKHKRCYTAI